MAAAAGGGGSVNPFLSDSEEDEPEEARAAGGGSSSSTEPAGPAYPQQPAEAAAGSPEELPGLRAAAPGDAAAGAGEPPRVPVDAIAAQLLRDQLLLTALELHTELLESGRELPRLRDFFSNPGNFERQSGTPPAGGALASLGSGSGLGGAGGKEPGQLNTGKKIGNLWVRQWFYYLIGVRYIMYGTVKFEVIRCYSLMFWMMALVLAVKPQLMTACKDSAPEFILPSPSRAESRSLVLQWHWKEAACPLAAQSFLSPGSATAVPQSRVCGVARADRAGSISTLDSLDFARYSDDGNRETDERVAENEVPLQERKNYKSSPEIQEPIRPLEKRALNFLVNEFLLKNSYKLTSITFSDENHDQDFELWDDVGLNIPKPPDLLQLYRDFGNHHFTARDVVDASVGVEDDELEADTPILGTIPVFETTPQSIEQCLIVQKLEDQISVLNSEKWSLMEQIQRLESEIDFLKNENFAVSTVYGVSPHPALKQVPLSVSEDNRRYLDIKSSENDNKHGNTEETSLALSAEVDSRTSKDDMLNSVPYKETEKLSSHAQSSKAAVHFDKPNRKLSPAFHQALLSFCRMSADSRLGSEVSRIADSEKSVMLMLGRCLPHIVPNVLLAKREINHKYPERRLLVAESCGALAPYLPKEIRSSLVLSMLQQMLMEDKADLVREAVIKSLGVIMGYIDDPDKYQQGFELLLSALGDPSERVVSATHQVFLPAYAAWTTELGKLQFHLIPTLLNKIEKLLREGEHGLDEHKLHMYLSALQSLIPSLFTLVLQNAPFTSKAKLQGEVPQIEVTRFPRPVSPLQDVAIIIGSREQLAVLLQLYDYQLEHEGTTGWESLLWVVNQLLPQLIEIVGKINVASTACVHEFSRFFWRLCRTFGKIFTNTKEEDRKLLVGFLEDVMTMLSLSHAHLDSLKASFVELSANPAYHELLLTVLWYGVVHTSALVRCTAARMFDLTLQGMSEALVDKRVAPALVTLSSDPEFSVRIATIPAFGTIMETVTQREVILSSMIKECEQKVENKTVQEPQGSMSIAASLVSEDTKTKFLNKMGQLTTSGAMLANVFQRKK
ncbi:hypothetical protein WISP_118830 [Willisornis vidua]|uniref:K1468 protein n=1 Tax=Willisornis vidua TaxID=1566151 RepID=A0ABQ9CYM8_9PASS|nr:hypothetical protein WISP_118830 [Willisornis vidua]